MLCFESRPTEGRDAFEQRVTTHLENIRNLANNADWDGLSAFLEDNQLWSNGVKEYFAGHQGRKCGYCERFVTDYGDVEHYRPKGAIFTLNTPGQEQENLNNRTGRTYHRHPEPDAWNSGYWWLAYSWDNYLMACGRCNQNWKNALFPIEGSRPNRPQEGDENTEVALLLDPFGNRDPAEHLEFTAGGAIRALNDSAVGQGTIDVCKLDRASLVDSRFPVAQLLDLQLTLLNSAIDNNPPGPERNNALRPVLESILHMGHIGSHHAGMVRIMFIQATGWTWQRLEDTVNELRAGG